ncbi:MAG: AAA family ATPase [Planctomycetota bacterium]
MTDKKTTLHKFAIGDSLTPVIRLAIDCLIPLLLSGHSGIGKSEFVHKLAAAIGRRVRVINMALYESAAELLGLPIIENGVTRYAKPAMLPEGPGWILLIEEATRAAPHVMAALYEFLTSRCIGEYVLPPDCVIVACMNPPGPEYDGHAFDRAMADRFMRIEVLADRDEWLQWAVDVGVHAAVLDTVREDSRLFELASPRSWFKAAKLLQAAESRGMERPLIEPVLAAMLDSVEAAHAVARHLEGVEQDHPLVPADVLNHYGRDPRLGRRVRELLQQGRTDTVEKLVFGINELLAGDALAGLVAAGGFDLDGLERFARDIPGDRGTALLATFAGNRAAGTTLQVDPEPALLGYRRSPLFRQVEQWRSAGQGHRLQALAHRVVLHLDGLDAADRTKALRSAPSVRESLGQLCEHLGEHAQPLQQTLRRLKLEPMKQEVE